MASLAPTTEAAPVLSAPSRRRARGRLRRAARGALAFIGLAAALVVPSNALAAGDGNDFTTEVKTTIGAVSATSLELWVPADEMGNGPLRNNWSSTTVQDWFVTESTSGTTSCTGTSGTAPYLGGGSGCVMGNSDFKDAGSSTNLATLSPACPDYHAPPYAFFAWVKTTYSNSAASSIRRIDSNKWGYSMISGHPAFYDGSAWTSATGTTVNDGGWHLVVWNNAGTSMGVYVDGALAGSTFGVSSTVSPTGCSDRQYFGGIGNAGVWTGTLGAMGQFKGTLTLAQIQTLYADRLNAVPSGSTTTTVTTTTTTTGPTTTVTVATYAAAPSGGQCEDVSGPTPCPVVATLDGDASQRLDLTWWGVWIAGGIATFALFSPLFYRAWKFWH